MKISQKEFDKLLQLDRIEYRLSRKDIEDRTENLSYSTPLFLFGFIIIANLLIYQINGEFIEAFVIEVYLVMVYFIVIFFINLIQIIIQSRLQERLDSKYFKVNRRK